MWKTILLFRVQRMPGSLEELILQPQADLVGFHGADDVGKVVGLGLNIEVAPFNGQCGLRAEKAADHEC